MAKRGYEIGRAQVRRRQRALNKPAEVIARKLGVTRVGLEVLARMAAGNGVGRTRGMAGVKLIAQGYVRDRERDPWTGTYSNLTITDAGREIVRRAREMGW